MADNNVLELEKTLQVDGQTYNINAVQADKVVNPLNIYKSNLNKKATKLIEFDGSAAKNIELVPASGGSFAGRITVPPVSDTTLKSDGETVLNYNDIVGKVVDRLLNTSAMATWDNNELTFTAAETPAVHGICVVLGNESDVSSFAESNNKNWTDATSETPPSLTTKWLPNYLYICRDSGDIYLGSADSTEAKLLSDITNDEVLTPKRIQVKENQWVTHASEGESNYGLDMANSDLINLNGLFFSDYANLNNEGLNFVQKHPNEHAIDHSTIKDPSKAAEIVYDRVYARDGKFYFIPNCKIRNEVQEAKVDESGNPVYTDPNPFEVYHSGILDHASSSLDANLASNKYISSYADVPEDNAQIVFKYASPDETRDKTGVYTGKGALYTRELRYLWNYLVTKIRTVFGFSNNNVLKAANGGTGQTDLDKVTIGQAKKIKVSYKKDTATAATDVYSNITIAPSASYPNGPTGGANGDIMILF